LEDGALKLTVAAPLPALALTALGDPGTLTFTSAPSLLLEAPPQALIKSAASSMAPL
jgi:hypothetical protein